MGLRGPGVTFILSFSLFLPYPPEGRTPLVRVSMVLGYITRVQCLGWGGENRVSRVGSSRR